MAGERRDYIGLPLACSSDDAVELFNKALRAFISFNESMLPYATKACELDGSFVLVRCMLAAYLLSDLQPPSGPRVTPHLEVLKNGNTHLHLTEREKAHVRAVLLYSSGDLPKAAEQWTAILVENPRDVLALRILFRAQFALGEFEKMRDVLSGLLPFWGTEDDLYPHVLAYYSYALEQSNQRDRAEELARKALDLQKKTPWAYHTISHVIEEERDPMSGVEFLTSSRELWKDTLYGGHLSWHLALYHLDLGNVGAVLSEYDSVLCEKACGFLGLVDAASLLWRLNVMGIDAGERWQKVVDTLTQHLDHRALTWFDTHMMMSLAHGKVTESTARLVLAERLLKNISEYAKSGVSSDSKVADVVGVPVCNALLTFGKEQYSEVISLLLPLKYDLVKLGGSWAQRQVFSVTLIHAAIRSKQLPLALALIDELRAMKPKSKTLEKLYAEVKGLHENMGHGPIKSIVDV